LIAPGSKPFHLVATINGGEESPPIAVELYWQAPNLWHRTVSYGAFFQDLTVNGGQVLEKRSENYFPIGLWTLVTAMVDPKTILATLQQGDSYFTKASSASDEMGNVCFDGDRRRCIPSAFGLKESVEASGHWIEFTDYRDFHGQRIARRLQYRASARDVMTAEVTEMSDLDSPDREKFAISRPTPPVEQLKVQAVGEGELRKLASDAPEIVWPQVLDGAVSGQMSFYVGLDTAGKLREIVPVHTANERANDSAIRQIERWKFKPGMQDGVPVQVEGILTFDLNTREYGPKEVLTDAEMRKLATSTAELVVPPGTEPPGSVQKIWVAVDADGYVIEWIAGDGPGGLTVPIVEAMKHWKFQPILIDGKPMPYRGEIDFHVN